MGSPPQNGISPVSNSTSPAGRDRWWAFNELFCPTPFPSQNTPLSMVMPGRWVPACLAPRRMKPNPGTAAVWEGGLWSGFAFHPVLAGLAEAVYSCLLRKQHRFRLMLKRQTRFGKRGTGIYTKAASDQTSIVKKTNWLGSRFWRNLVVKKQRWVKMVDAECVPRTHNKGEGLIPTRTDMLPSYSWVSFLPLPASYCTHHKPKQQQGCVINTRKLINCRD